MTTIDEQIVTNLAEAFEYAHIHAPESNLARAYIAVSAELSESQRGALANVMQQIADFGCDEAQKYDGECATEIVLMAKNAMFSVALRKARE